MDQLLERYLDQFDGAASTLKLYQGYVRNHILPFLGKIKVGALDADTLDSFYAELQMPGPLLRPAVRAAPGRGRAPGRAPVRSPVRAA